MSAAEHTPRPDPHCRGRLGAGIAGLGGLLTAGALILSGCASPSAVRVIRTAAPHAADVALVRFTSCADALANLRAAAAAATRSASSARSGLPAGTGYGSASAARGASASAPGAAVAAGGAGAAGAAAPAAAAGAAAAASGSAVSPGSYPGANTYSGTNTATAGVDEPDLVKTDGQRIVTVIGNVLRVMDVRTRQLTGVLDLTAGASPYSEGPASLLLSGNHALVVFGQSYMIAGGPVTALPQSAGAPTLPQPGTAWPIVGPRMELIDLSGSSPRIISEYTMDGAFVDARQVGSVVRVVVHSAPRIFYPQYAYPPTGQGAQSGGLPAGQAAASGTGASGSGGASRSGAAIASAPISAWLPRYQVTDGAGQHTGLVDCAAVSHPADSTYSGTSMLTVLTFDLSGDSLGDGLPVTVVADGQTVYSDGASLFIANDRQWIGPAQPMMAPGYAGATAQAGVSSPAAVPQQYTGLYKFDISVPGRPVYQASGAVPGWLLGSAEMAQYSLSQWNGTLRVATTTEGAYWGGQPAQSAVYTLQQVGSQLVIAGKVGGLGNGEQLYAVRFAGPMGYVVTFRQVDPLYTLDLSDPAQPRVAGQLLLTGYSAYLHPIDATHLIGVGQDAGADGQTMGTQISLFDVSDPTAPVRLAVFRLPFGHSEAEFDPHAFLYWPATRLLVIPVQLPGGVQPQTGSATASPPVSTQYQPAMLAMPVSEAIVLRVGDHSITSLGTIIQPATPGYPAGGQIRRSLIAGDALWTLSDAGLKANDLTTLGPLGWVPFG